MEKFFDFLNNTSVVITIATIMIIAFSRTIIKIFNMGVTFKSNLASKKDLKDFESEMKQDLRGYVVQIQKSVSDSVMKVIEARLSNIDDIQKTAGEIKVLKTEIEMTVKNSLEKYDDIKNLSDSVRSLSNKVQRLEYNSDTKNISRRTEK